MHTIDQRNKSPCGNTGTQTTDGIFLDWLACTFLDGDSPQVIAQELGTKLDDHDKWSHGTQGYTDVWPIYGGWIASNPDRPDMGTHLDLSGKALDQFRLETHKTDTQIVIWFIALGAKFTRLDVAFDVYAKEQLDLETIQASIKDGLCVSRWKTAKEYAQYRLADGQTTGDSSCTGFTFGSRSSRAYLRMYDKRTERITKTGQCSKDYWIRVEMEYKKDNAQGVAQLIQTHESLDWFGANLRYYLDIKSPGQTDKNRSRWSSAQWWVDLTSSIKTRLPIVKKIVQDVVIAAKRWIKEQCAPTIAFLLQYDGGDMSWLTGIMLDGQARMNKKHLRTLKNSVESG